MTAASPEPAAPAAGVTVDAGGGGTRWVARGALTFASVGPVLEAAQALPLPASGVVECGGITAVDSAAVALLLALKRRAAAQGARLTYVNLPAALTTLAALYGVEEMLDA